MDRRRCVWTSDVEGQVRMSGKRWKTVLRVAVAFSGLALTGVGGSAAVTTKADATVASVGVGCSIIVCTENHNEVLL
jgi:hypothetical protein